MTNEESVKLYEVHVSLDLHTNLLEMKQSLSLSLTKSSSRSEEGSGGPPELLSKALSRKSTQFIY